MVFHLIGGVFTITAVLLYLPWLILLFTRHVVYFLLIDVVVVHILAVYLVCLVPRGVLLILLSRVALCY